MLIPGASDELLALGEREDGTHKPDWVGRVGIRLIHVVGLGLRWEQVVSISRGLCESMPALFQTCKGMAPLVFWRWAAGGACVKLSGLLAAVMRTQGSLRLILNTKLWAQMQMDKASEKSIRITATDAEDQGVKVFLISVSSGEGWRGTLAHCWSLS